MACVMLDDAPLIDTFPKRSAANNSEILLPITMPTQIARRMARDLDRAGYPDSGNVLLERVAR